MEHRKRTVYSVAIIFFDFPLCSSAGAEEKDLSEELFRL
jgi:hypothetical protein